MGTDGAASTASTASTGNVADESTDIVASAVGTSDSGTNNVAIMGSVGDADETLSIDNPIDSVASSSPSCGSRGAQGLVTTVSSATKSRGRRKDKKIARSQGSTISPPRSQEETLHLIRLRDDMINAKHKEVLLLSKQNQGLREGIDTVETEMASLHGVIEAKDEHAQKLRRECDRLRRDMKRLHVEGEEHKGQENAMEMAVTQNTRLLKLLEQEELKREHVLSERDEARAEVGELKDRVRNSDEHHAKRSAKMEMKLIKIMGENMTLREKYSGVDERLAKLPNDLESTRQKASFDVATSKEELSAVRQDQYLLLSQLQESRDELQRTKDCLEVKERDLETCRQQSAEIKMRLATLQSDLTTVETNAREREAKADEDARLLTARLTKEIGASESLHDEVTGMGRTILRLTERHKDLHAEVLKHEGEGKRLRTQIQQAEKRELQLRQKIIRLESGISLELTQKRLHGAINAFNSQIKTPVTATSCVPPKSPSCAGSASEHGTAVGMGDVAWSRRQVLLKYMRHFKQMASQVVRTPDNTVSTVNAVTGGCFSEEDLDLSGCGLEDADVDELMDTVASCPGLTSLDLSMNHIGDAGAASVARALRQASCNLTRINLRCNQIGMEGVRGLARSLEENSSRGVSHVYVHREGRIDALGRVEGRRPEESSPGSFVSVAVIDTCDNIPDDRARNSHHHLLHPTNDMPTSASSKSTLRSTRCRGKRKDGGTIGGICGGIGQAMDGSRSRARREVHMGNNNKQGIANIREIAKQRNVRHVMTKAVYLEKGNRVTLPVCHK